MKFLKSTIYFLSILAFFVCTGFLNYADAAFTARTPEVANGGTNISLLAVNKPIETVEGDIMFTWIGYRGSATDDMVNSIPAGWIELGRDTSTRDSYWLFYKIAGTSEATNYIWGTSASGRIAITVLTYTSGNFDPMNPIDVVSNTVYRTNDTNLRATSMNVSAINSPLIFIGGEYSNAVRTHAKPTVPTTGWIENYDGGNNISDYSRTFDSFIWSGSGATGDIIATISASATTKHAFAVALNSKILTPPSALNFSNDSEGTLLDGGRSSQQITITGTNFGAGPSDGIGNTIKIGTYIIPDANVTTWNDTTIVFTIPSSATTYGGVGVNGLIVRANELDDTTPLDFYIYPNITSISLNSEQIGINIIVSGDHFETSAGSAIINTKPATVIGEWGETSLTVRIPGQEGAININGKIQITRNDTKTSNQFPIDPTNFTILAPSVSGSNPASETTEQSSVSIEFSGLGIDTDIGTNPVLKLSKSGETDIIGTGYSLINPYQTISATFNLSSAVIGAWDLVIINMDGQSGTCSGCFTINPVTGPIVTGIDPVFGLTANTNITTISGSNFDSGAIVKLTKVAQPDITTSTAFTFTNATTLSGGAFDLTTKSLGYWNVVVTNSDFQTGSYDAGFEIRSSVPSDPINIYQFKNNTDTAQPPTTEITTGNGIGGQVDIYFRMNMQGGLIGELYYPQIELKTIGTPFDGTFVEGSGIMFNGTAEQGWVNIIGADNESYHWQARIRNSSGTSPWASFGGNTDPNDIDIYIDNTIPSIDTPCSSSVISTSDLGATIQWNTSDLMSGAQTPPGSGAYATSQVQYELTSSFIDWSTTPGIITAESLWENSPHQVTLSSLSPDSDYTFRMKAKDLAGNEGTSVNCNFATEGARPIKTIEFFILQESNKNTGTKIKKQFNVTVPENTAITNSIQVKSAYIEISGISSATGNQTINAGLLRGDQTLQIGPVGNNYSLDSTGTTTQFTILFDVLSPGSDNENINDITSGGNYNYTLFLNGDGVTDVCLFSSKLILTYNYKP